MEIDDQKWMKKGESDRKNNKTFMMVFFVCNH